MPKVRNISGEDRTTAQRLVLAGAAFEVDEGETWGYTQQLATWEPYDDAAKAEHQENLDAIAALIAADAVVVLPSPPAGNASRDEWAGWVTALGVATPEDLDGMSRDEIRDTYKTEE